MSWQRSPDSIRASFSANFLHGLVYYLPIVIVTYLGGFLWEGLFAWKRGHEINEGFFVTGILFSLTLPPTIPLWLVFFGITFGVVIGKEVFGGTGKNFLNPALVGRVFLFFAYPAYMTGDTVWTAVDNYTGATALATAKGADLAVGSVAALEQAGFQWRDTFFGTIPGSIGETSTLMIAIGGVALVFFKVASWRIMAAVVVGMVASTLLFNTIGSDTNPMFALPWYWHLTMGGFAFGVVYMATDPKPKARKANSSARCSPVSRPATCPGNSRPTARGGPAPLTHPYSRPPRAARHLLTSI